MIGTKIQVPSGAKAQWVRFRSGTAEAVPFQIAPVKPAVVLAAPHFTMTVTENVLTGATSFSHGRRYSSFSSPVPANLAANSRV